MKLEPFELESGDRVRCVRRAEKFLTIGQEYLIRNITGQYLWLVDDSGKCGNWLADRFKPVVRVKAPMRFVPDVTVHVNVGADPAAVERLQSVLEREVRYRMGRDRLQQTGVG
jgi:hypothetical protein